MLNAALTEAIPDALVRVDRDGLVLSYRAPEQGTTLLSSEPVLGRTITECFPEPVATEVSEAVSGAFYEDAPQHLEFEHAPDGEAERHVYEGRVIRAGQNEAVVIIRDTTRQRRTASSRDRLHSILDRILDPVITVTRSGDIQYVNPAGLDLLSSDNAELLDRNFGDFLPDWVRRQVLSAGLAAAHQDGSWEGEGAFLSSDGVEVPVAVTAIAHPAPSG
jgi:PAS domain S-box-containing protein